MGDWVVYQTDSASQPDVCLGAGVMRQTTLQSAPRKRASFIVLPEAWRSSVAGDQGGSNKQVVRLALLLLSPGMGGKRGAR